MSKSDQPTKTLKVRIKDKHVPLTTLDGEIFGSLRVIRRVGLLKKLECLCDCGTVVEVKESKLVSGHTKSCGCKRKETPVKRMLEKAIDSNKKLTVGMRFGRLTLSSVYPTVAVCDCGNTVDVQRTASLFNGDKQSCGCLRKDVAREKQLSIARRHRSSKGFPQDVPMQNENKEQRNRFVRETVPAVFKRDDYTCQLCGERGVVLNAHHIEKWADSPSLRFEISNAVTLCRRCHIDIAHDGNVHGDCNNEVSELLRSIVAAKTCSSCVACGSTHQRDVNAAKNILGRGRAPLAVGILGL